MYSGSPLSSTRSSEAVMTRVERPTLMTRHGNPPQRTSAYPFDLEKPSAFETSSAPGSANSRETVRASCGIGYLTMQWVLPEACEDRYVHTMGWRFCRRFMCPRLRVASDRRQVPFDVRAGRGGGCLMVPAIAGLANRRSRAILFRCSGGRGCPGRAPARRDSPALARRGQPIPVLKPGRLTSARAEGVRHPG